MLFVVSKQKKTLIKRVGSLQPDGHKTKTYKIHNLEKQVVKRLVLITNFFRVLMRNLKF